jgi:hypothetical protein
MDVVWAAIFAVICASGAHDDSVSDGVQRHQTLVVQRFRLIGSEEEEAVDVQPGRVEIEYSLASLSAQLLLIYLQDAWFEEGNLLRSLLSLEERVSSSSSYDFMSARRLLSAAGFEAALAFVEISHMNASMALLCICTKSQ